MHNEGEEAASPPLRRFFLPKESDISLFEQLRLQEGGTTQALEAFDQIESSRERAEQQETHSRGLIELEACE